MRFFLLAGFSVLLVVLFLSLFIKTHFESRAEAKRRKTGRS